MESRNPIPRIPGPKKRSDPAAMVDGRNSPGDADDGSITSYRDREFSYQISRHFLHDRPEYLEDWKHEKIRPGLEAALRAAIEDGYFTPDVWFELTYVSFEDGPHGTAQEMVDTRVLAAWNIVAHGQEPPQRKPVNPIESQPARRLTAVDYSPPHQPGRGIAR